MRILLLDNSHLPTIGGKEIVVHHLARQYQALGHDVRVAGPSGYRAYKSIDMGYPIDAYPSLPLLSRDQQWRFRARRIIKSGSYDAIHAHMTYPCAFHALRVLRKANSSLPLVVTPHGADIHKAPEVNFGMRLKPDLDEKICWTVKNATATTAISASVRSSLIDAGANPEKLHDISNGVDLDRLQTPASVQAREWLGVPDDAPLLVSIGNYHPRKGHNVLVDALANTRNQNIHLAIVGRTSETFVASVKNSPHGDRVHFTGALEFPIAGITTAPDYLVAMLQQCTAYVSSSVGEGTEGLSLALLEAMAAGACPVATSVSGNKDIIEDQNNGLLVQPDSAHALAAAIDTLIATPELRDRMAEKARNTVASFGWRQIAKQYLDVLKGSG